MYECLKCPCGKRVGKFKFNRYRSIFVGNKRWQKEGCLGKRPSRRHQIYGRGCIGKRGVVIPKIEFFHAIRITACSGLEARDVICVSHRIAASHHGKTNAQCSCSWTFEHSALQKTSMGWRSKVLFKLAVGCVYLLEIDKPRADYRVQSLCVVREYWLRLRRFKTKDPHGVESSKRPLMFR